MFKISHDKYFGICGGELYVESALKKYIKTSLERSRCENDNFLTILCRKNENIVLGYKKWSKNTICKFFEIFDNDLYIKSILKNS